MKNSLGRKIFLAIDVLSLTTFMLLCLYPMLYVIFASFSDSTALMSHRGLLFAPINFNLATYEAVFSNSMILTGYMNTGFIMIFGITISVFLTMLGAYFLSRSDVMFKGVIMGFIIFTMFFSGGMIPFYLTVKGYGLHNSLWALILPTAINTFNLIIMRTSFMQIPTSLEESATIDGAGHFTILFKIVMPLSKAIIAVMILYYGVSIWNSWFNAMIFLTDRAKFPLQLVIKEILIQNDTTAMMQGNSNVGDGYSISETIKYGVIVIATVPILVIYPLLQKYFISGVMIGAVKG